MNRADQQSQARRSAERRGRLGEILASLWLQLKGYRLLARRVRTPVGEFDLALQRGRTLAIVEVKARSSAAKGLEAVTDRAKQRICAAAELWASRQSALVDLDLRFDLVIITPRSLPIHVRGAWRPDDPT